MRPASQRRHRDNKLLRNVSCDPVSGWAEHPPGFLGYAPAPASIAGKNDALLDGLPSRELQSTPHNVNTMSRFAISVWSDVRIR